MADGDAEEATRYREVAEAVVELRQRAVDECFDGAAEVRQDAFEKLSEARRELKELNRICLRHSAKTLDAQRRAAGQTSDIESEAIFYDITNPISR